MKLRVCRGIKVGQWDGAGLVDSEKGVRLLKLGFAPAGRSLDVCWRW